MIRVFENVLNTDDQALMYEYGRQEQKRRDCGIVFNPDCKRLQYNVAVTHPSHRLVERIIKNYTFARGRIPCNSCFLYSKKGCCAQPLHFDYDPHQKVSKKEPLSALIALEDGTRLNLNNGQIELNAGDMCIFDRFCAHGGAAYDRKSNLRFFTYLSTPEFPSPTNETYLLHQ